MDDVANHIRSALGKRRYSPKTISTYLYWVAELESFYSGKSITNLTNQEILEFFQFHRQRRKLSSSSIRQARAALVWTVKHLPVGGRDIDIPKEPYIRNKLLNYPSQTQIHRILDCIPNNTYRSLIATIYGLGLELREALSIKVRDVSISQGTISVSKQRKKGMRLCIIPDALKENIRGLTEGKKAVDPLFTAKPGVNRAISESSIQRAFIRARKLALITEPYTIRCLRVAYIKHLELLGFSLLAIFSHIGQSKLQLMVYYGNDEANLVPITYSPLDRIIVEEQESAALTLEPYISETRITEISAISLPKFDFTRLLTILREINVAHRSKSYFAIGMLVRSVIDHVPPIFGFRTFNEVASNYSGTKSFKQTATFLNNSLRNIANSHLHSTIRARESVPTFQQVDFRADIDVLLGEVIRIAHEI